MADKQPTNPIQEQAEVHTLTSLEQVRILANPLRLRLLEAFCPEARTTKQVAELLGEKPTRLYHHVEALSKAGLIRLHDTRPVRGTVEKYYRAVAKTFRADPKIFEHPDARGDEREALGDVITGLLETTAAEVREVLRSGKHDLASGEDGVLSHMELRASETDVRELQGKLKALLEELGDRYCHGEASDAERRYRLSIAYFPLDGKSKPTPSR